MRVGQNALGGVHGAQNHFLAAAARGDDADSGFDQAHVQFGVGLAAGGVERDLRSPAEAEAKGRHHHRARAELDGRGHALESTDGKVDIVPLPFLNQEQYASGWRRRRSCRHRR